MITGSLREKNGIWQMVFTLPKNANVKRPQRSESTHLPVRGNKRRAEQMLAQRLAELRTLDVHPNTVVQNKSVFNHHIKTHIPFIGLKLQAVTASLIEDYYTAKRREHTHMPHRNRNRGQNSLCRYDKERCKQSRIANAA